MMWRHGFFVAIGACTLVIGACESAKDKVAQQLAGDPVPSGMGVMATTATSAGVAAVLGVINEAILPSPSTVLKPGGNLVAGIFPEQSSITCSDGGSVSLSGEAPATVTATFTNCTDGPTSVTGAATLTFPDDMQTCTEDIAEGSPTHDVPVSLTTAVQTGTQITVGGQVITLTNFSLTLTNPVYNGAPDRSELHGTCSILSAHVHVRGQMSTDTAGETTTIDLGQSSLDIDFSDQVDHTQATIDGTLTVDTLCTGGPYDLTIATNVEDPLIIPHDGNGTPTAGTVTVTHGSTSQDVNFASNPAPSAIPCSGF